LRLFIAAYPTPRVIQHLGEFLPRLAIAREPEPGKSLRLAPPEQWHVTLAFIGEVPDGSMSAARDAMRSVEVPAMTLRVGGGGRFGRGRFTTVWAGLRGDVEKLDELALATRKALKRARLPFDPRPYNAHLTLARPGDRLPPEDVSADIFALSRYEGPDWFVEDVRLMRSQLGPKPRYDVVARA
jgi:2'-5' RNA ligase